MEPEQIKALLCAGMPGCEFAVEGGGGKFVVTAVGDAFAGLNAVKRQQRIYAVLNEQIASGAIHAVTMRLYTADEFAGMAKNR